MKLSEKLLIAAEILQAKEQGSPVQWDTCYVNASGGTDWLGYEYFMSKNNSTFETTLQNIISNDEMSIRIHPKSAEIIELESKLHELREEIAHLKDTRTDGGTWH